MDILYENYKLEPQGSRFDLYEQIKVKTVNKETGKEETKDDWKIVGYSIRFETCLHAIITRQIPKKKKGKSLTIEQYIQAYKVERQKVSKSLN